MLGVLGLSPATKNPSFVGTEELEGPGGGVGRRVVAARCLCWQLLFFPCTLSEACRKGNCCSLVVHTAMEWWERRAIKRENFWLQRQLAQWLG